MMFTSCVLSTILLILIFYFCLHGVNCFVVTQGDYLPTLNEDLLRPDAFIV